MAGLHALSAVRAGSLQADRDIACRAAGLVSPAEGEAFRVGVAPRRRHAARIVVQASGDGSSSSTATSEPKWKQKLAAAEQHAAETRQATLKMQEEYRQRQAEEERAKRRAGTATEGGGGEGEALGALPWVSYLTEDGKIVDCSKAGAKASVYAIFDESKQLQYVGVSRQVYQSMRLHFARYPQLCHWVKVEHIARPSRSALEGIREQWISENGAPVPGNDGGGIQSRWENAVDCKPLMTDAERAAVEEAAPGPPTAKALKEVARRVEKELEAEFKARNCSEVLRFDPKLKESCLLDLKSVAHVPDTAVPTEKPKLPRKAPKKSPHVNSTIECAKTT